MTVIEAFITNLGKYNEGELCGDYLKLPATKEEVKALLAKICVDGVLYEEFFITDYETDIEGLYDRLGEYESLDELNYLAALLEGMDEWDIEKFSAALEYGEYTENVRDLINLAQNLECYGYYPGIMDAEDLGRYYGDDLLDVPEHLTNYIDYESFGRDISLDCGGVFANTGYIESNHDTFIEHYDGRHIPEEYCIFSYPDPPDKMPIKSQLAMCGRMAAVAPAAGKFTPARDER
jgi:antirestriction protein